MQTDRSYQTLILHEQGWQEIGASRIVRLADQMEGYKRIYKDRTNDKPYANQRGSWLWARGYMLCRKCLRGEVPTRIAGRYCHQWQRQRQLLFKAFMTL
uniref:Uncharacterized protein n=1 Tax=Rhizobium rhizogenes TaxID=359 RepID=A0A7S4ZSX1_RHIRH|nr:hypothetical protein pC6.5d_687 [Rhizobium rhizogenes]